MNIENFVQRLADTPSGRAALQEDQQSTYRIRVDAQAAFDAIAVDARALEQVLADAQAKAEQVLQEASERYRVALMEVRKVASRRAAAYSTLATAERVRDTALHRSADPRLNSLVDAARHGEDAARDSYPTINALRVDELVKALRSVGQAAAQLIVQVVEPEQLEQRIKQLRATLHELSPLAAAAAA